jgi:hypothetical protein
MWWRTFEMILEIIAWICVMIIVIFLLAIIVIPLAICFIIIGTVLAILVVGIISLPFTIIEGIFELFKKKR